MNVSFLVYLDAQNKENIDLPPKKRCFARSEVIKWSKKVTQDMMIGVQWSYTKHIFSISSLLTKGCIVQHANKSHTCALRMDVKERFVNGQVGQSVMFMRAYPSLSPAKFNHSSIASLL